MTAIDLQKAAADLPEAWRSRLLGRVGPAGVKVLSMDGREVPPEVHEDTEALFVVDGVLELEVSGEPVSVGAGELYLMPAGTAHAVLPGSRGTLVIVEMPEH